MSKVKTNKKKSKTQLKDYLQAGRKRKTPYREVYNGLNGYSSTYSGLNAYPGYGGDVKNEFLSYTGSNSLSLETAADVYRNVYPTFATPGVYPGTDGLTRLDMDRHGYTNGFYYDSVTRPYQHTIQYPSNGYSDLVSHSKYGYDVSKYGYDSLMGGSYSLDLSKRNNYYDTSSKYGDSYRGYDSQSTSSENKYGRLNGSYESLRKTSVYENSTGLLQCDGSVSSPTSCPSSNDLSGRQLHSLYQKDNTSEYQQQSSTDCSIQQNTDHSKHSQPQQHTGYASVIRSTSPRGKSSPSYTNPSSSSLHLAPPQSDCDMNGWSSCTVGKAQSPHSNLHSDNTSTVSDPSPASASTPVVTDNMDNRLVQHIVKIIFKIVIVVIKHYELFKIVNFFFFFNVKNFE